MEILKTIIELLKVSIWPAVALILAFLFKKVLIDRLGSLTKAKLPGGIALCVNIVETPSL